MEIVDLNTSKKMNLKKTGVALGNFDGLHKGHMVLIDQMIYESHKRGFKSSVLLFRNHTKKLLLKNKKVEILLSNEDKFKILEEAGIDIIYLIDFNKDLMKLDGISFVEDVLVRKMNVGYITIGFDYKFGYRAENTSRDLYDIAAERGIETNIIDAIYVDNELISSTRIRNLIYDGNIKKANRYLGRNYRIKGKVVHGKKRGHKLGFPTANLERLESFVTPKTGVYKTITHVDNREYKSLTNIGYNPTFDDDSLTIESHIIDFNKKIYGKLISVEFIDFIRDEIRFKSKEDLINQMNIDLEKIMD